MKIFKEELIYYREEDVRRLGIQFFQFYNTVVKESVGDGDFWEDLLLGYLQELALRIKPDLIKTLGSPLSSDSEFNAIDYEGKGILKDTHVKYLEALYKKWKFKTGDGGVRSMSSDSGVRKYQERMNWWINKIISDTDEELTWGMSYGNIKEIPDSKFTPLSNDDHSLIQQLELKLSNEVRKRSKNFLHLQKDPSRGDSLDSLKESLEKEGLSAHFFVDSTLEELLGAISTGNQIEDIDIRSQVQNPQFRFVARDLPKLSLAASEAIARTFQLGKEMGTTNVSELSKRGIDAIKENADDFAKKMYEVIENLKREEKITSFRATVKMLNNKKIPTDRGGDWHIGTLQNLTNRWKELGLVENKPN